MADSNDLHRILAVLRSHADGLREHGVEHVSVIGSVARGDSSFDSDVDVLVTLDASRRLDAFDYAGIMVDLEQWIGRPVDVARRDTLKPHVRPRALAEDVRAF